MSVDHRLQKLFNNFKGLDKRSSDLNRESEYATEIKNAMYRKSGAISKRNGYHGISGDTGGGYGLVTYKNVNKTTGAVTEELLCVDTELKKLTKTNLTITYSGSGNAWYSLYLDTATSTFKFKIEDASSVLLDYDLGDGITSGSTLTDLKNIIHALSNFTCTGASTNKAAFLDLAESVSISSSGTDVPYYEWAACTKGDTGVTNPFTAYLRSGGNLDDTELENASFAQLNNVLYISNGYDELMKYDGTRYYKAGLPAAPAITSVVDAGSGTSKTHSGSDDKHDYMYIYEFTDDKGNIISSVQSETKTYTASNNNDTTITIPAFPQAGFDFASTKLKIKIYRTAGYSASPGVFYHLTGKDQTVANSSSTYTITDDVTTATIQTSFNAFSEPIKKHSLPPKGKYITTFQDCLVIAGQRENVNNVQYSLPYNAATSEIGSEYFPDDDNAAIVESSFGDKITSIAPLKDVLYIFHKNSIHTLSGDIRATSGISYKIDLLTTEGGIGCESHNSIQEYGSNLFFLSDNGIYSINNSKGYPTEISAPIQPEFKKLGTTYSKNKAISFNWVKKNVILFMLPVETLDDGAGTAEKAYTTTSDSKLFIYDTFSQAWLEWDSIDCTGGIANFGEEIYFASRELDSDTDKVSYLYKMQDKGSTYDYADHTSPVNFIYKTNWESLGEPTVPKKFLRLKLYAMDSDETFESSSFAVDVKIQKNYIKDDVGTINMDFGASTAGGWGAAPWGSSSWGNHALNGIKTKLPSGKTRSLLLNLENKTANENVLISGYELEIATPYRLEIKE
jgi:hypothetical protein